MIKRINKVIERRKRIGKAMKCICKNVMKERWVMWSYGEIVIRQRGEFWKSDSLYSLKRMPKITGMQCSGQEMNKDFWYN